MRIEEGNQQYLLEPHRVHNGINEVVPRVPPRPPANNKVRIEARLKCLLQALWCETFPNLRPRNW
jgi:hypothetical protein